MARTSRTSSDSVEQGLGSEGSNNKLRNVAMLSVAGAAASSALLGFGISPGDIASQLPGLDSAIRPDVPVFSEITRGMVGVNEALRSGSTAVAAGALAVGVSVRIAAANSPKWRRARSMSRASTTGPSSPNSRRMPNRVVRALTGTALATTVLVAAASGIEHEVADGPTRAIDSTITLLSPSNPTPFWLVQNRGGMFMNNSYVPRAEVDALAAAATSQGVRAVPFSRELVDLRSESGADSRTSMVLGVSDVVFESVSGIQQAGAETDCARMSVVADMATGKSIGDRVRLNDHPVAVVATLDGASSMNRVGVVARSRDVAECLQIDAEAPYYGVVMDGDVQTVRELVAEHGLAQRSELLSTAELKGNNKRFWQANGTPIMLQMMGYIMGFGYIANRNERRADLENNKKELGMMRAIGVSVRDMRIVESLRALRESTTAAIAAGPLAVGLAAVINAAEHGLRVGISPREVLVGFSVTLGAKLYGARRAMTKFAKKQTAYEAMRG